MSFTLTTLTASVQEWTQNDESTFVAEIPFFIKNAEERIFKTVDLDYFRKNVTGVATSGNKFLQKPSDYLATWISTNAPDALLYGTLVEAYTFMKGEKDLLDLYNGRYLESIARLKNYAEGRNYSDSFREGLVRQKQT
jgi:hypothetical protein